MRRGKKRALLGVAAVVLFVAVGVLTFSYRTQTVWVESAPYARVSDAPARVLVVVYSRTGNTLGAAKEAARTLDAELLRIEAPAYPRTLGGQLQASRDADDEVTTTPIEHAPVELSRYDLIILCAPTWWFRPAPPLWSFVEEHDFGGKPVFLLMTGNSRLTEERTGKFGALVEAQGGEYLGRHFVRRGRIYWQRTAEEVNTEVHEVLEVFRRERLGP